MKLLHKPRFMDHGMNDIVDETKVKANQIMKYLPSGLESRLLGSI